jgi:hypothetical protein
MPLVTIYKTFWGAYIDFETLISISESKFIDRLGSGGWSVEFSIFFKDSNPITYSRELNENEQTFLTPDFPELWPKNIKDVKRSEHYLALADGHWITARDTWKFLHDGHELILACSNLQKQIDQIVNDWESWKKQWQSVKKTKI